MKARSGGAVVDSSGSAVTTIARCRAHPMEKVTEIVNAQCGLDLSYEDIQQMGKSVLKEEKAFNLRAGLTPGAGLLPEFFRDEPLPPSNLVFDVPASEIDSFWDF